MIPEPSITANSSYRNALIQQLKKAEYHPVFREYPDTIQSIHQYIHLNQPNLLHNQNLTPIHLPYRRAKASVTEQLASSALRYQYNTEYIILKNFQKSIESLPLYHPGTTSILSHIHPPHLLLNDPSSCCTYSLYLQSSYLPLSFLHSHSLTLLLMAMETIKSLDPFCTAALYRQSTGGGCSFLKDL